MNEYGIHMIVGRIIVLVLCVILTYHFAFRRTPELDGVKNAAVYRLSYGMLVLRGLGYIAFDIFNLFPLE